MLLTSGGSLVSMEADNCWWISIVIVYTFSRMVVIRRRPTRRRTRLWSVSLVLAADVTWLSPHHPMGSRARSKSHFLHRCRANQCNVLFERSCTHRVKKDKKFPVLQSEMSKNYEVMLSSRREKSLASIT